MEFSGKVSQKIELGEVVSVNVSAGGIPKIPQPQVAIETRGIVGDHQAHEKHRRPDRALSLWDIEILEQLCQEGYSIVPGAIGENILFKGVNVQGLSPGTLLELGSVVIKLEQPRKPCFILDPLSESLKDVIVGRCGYMASVLVEGKLLPGDPVKLVSSN